MKTTTNAARRGRNTVRARHAAQPATVKAATLLEPQAEPRIGSVTSPWRDSVADTLTPERLARLMRDADQGEVEKYLTLAEEMEERDGHYRSVLGTRRMAVAGAPVMVEAASDGPDDVAIAEFVEARVKRPEFEGLVLDLMDAVGKGFSCVEIVWQRGAKVWEPVGYKHRPARHFTFDDDTMETPRLRSLEHPAEGEELRPFKWLVHRPRLLSGVPIRSGLARTVALCYAAKRFTLAQWMTFLEVYGVPLRVGKFPSSMESKKKELLDVLRRMGTDAAAVIPEGMAIEFHERKGGSARGLHLEKLEYWDKQISKVVLGQTMTTDDGSSLAQATIHNEVRHDIGAADERACSATVNRDLVRALVDLNFGPREVYPTVRLGREEREDLDSLMRNVKVFVDLGGRVQESEIRDRLGLMEPEEGADLLKPSSGAAMATDVEAEEDGDAGEEDAPVRPGKRGKKGVVEDDDEVSGGSGNSDRQANRRASFAVGDTDEDVVDELRAEHLDDGWRNLVDEGIGELVRRAQSASTYVELREVLDELAVNHGESLPVKLVTKSLAKAAFGARGVGDATDEVTP